MHAKSSQSGHWNTGRGHGQKNKRTYDPDAHRSHFCLGALKSDPGALRRVSLINSVTFEVLCGSLLHVTNSLLLVKNAMINMYLVS